MTQYTTPLGRMLQRKLNRCTWCGAIMEDCACTDSPGDEHLPMLPEFEQVPLALWPGDKKEFIDSCYSSIKENGIHLATCRALWPEKPATGFMEFLPPITKDILRNSGGQ